MGPHCVYYRIMDEENNISIVPAAPSGQDFIPVPKAELEAIKARTAKRILNITERSIEGLETLLHRIDGIDNAIASACELDKMTPQELYAYFNQAQQSFKLRQDFVRTVAGYEVDTSHVPTEKDEKLGRQQIDEDVAVQVQQEILKRSMGHEVGLEGND